MSIFHNPFDPDVRLGKGCSCGRHSSQAAHDLDVQSVQDLSLIHISEPTRPY